MQRAYRGARGVAAVLAAIALASCGGSSAPTGVQAQACSPNNPYRLDATSSITSGDIGTEKTWLRDYVDRSYLWYDKVPAVNASGAPYSNDTIAGFYGSIDTYFLDLTRPLVSPPGKPVDKFSFTYPTADWDKLINSGSTVGYGIEWHFGLDDTAAQHPRRLCARRLDGRDARHPARRHAGAADNVAADDNTAQVDDAQRGTVPGAGHDPQPSASRAPAARRRSTSR